MRSPLESRKHIGSNCPGISGTRIFSNCPGYRKGTTTIVLLVPDEVQTLA